MNDELSEQKTTVTQNRTHDTIETGEASLENNAKTSSCFHVGQSRSENVVDFEDEGDITNPLNVS